MLAALFTGPILSAIAGQLFSGLEGAWQAYVNKEISKDELHAKIEQALIASFADVEKAYADSLTKTFASFMDAASRSVLMQQVWATVAITQLFVLLWHQVGIPAVVYMTGHGYPPSGTTVTWAYALLALCLGGGALAMKTGPGASRIAEDLKALGK